MRTRLLIVLSLLLSLPLLAHAHGHGPGPGAPQESPFVAATVEHDGVTYGYRVLAPENVVEGETYPLVLFLHGAGERGDDNRAQLAHFPERMLGADYRESFPCYIVAPQCPKDADWADGGRGLAQGGGLSDAPRPALEAALLALEHVVRTEPVDTDRLYLTGLSMGGAGTWDLAARHPEWFAAAVPICGGGDVRQASRLAGLPLWAWHGADDTLVDPERTREMVAAVKAAGGEVKYSELEGVGHGSWVAAYAPDAALAWMFTQRRDVSQRLALSAKAFAEACGPEERVAFLGDSITQAGNAAGGYVDTLRTALKRAQPDAEVIPAGISGHKVPDLLKRYRADVIQKGATVVFIYIGINDVWHSEWGKGTSEEEFEAGLRLLVQEFRESGADVVLATPSVIGEKPVGENRLDAELEAFAAISRRVAAEEGATLCDLQRAFHDHLRLLTPADVEQGVLTSDGVHLNEAGNALVALEAARALRTALAAHAK